MNEIKLRQALSLLDSISQRVPGGDIEEKYVERYHQALTKIQNETGADLTDFFISRSEITRQETGRRIGPRIARLDRGPDVSYTEERFCDRDMFLIQLGAAINYINSFILYPTGWMLKIPPNE